MLEIALIIIRTLVKNEADNQHEERYYLQASGKQGERYMINIIIAYIVAEHRNGCYEPAKEEKQGDQPKKIERFVIAENIDNSLDDPQPVIESIQLGDAPYRAIFVANGELEDAKALVKRMQRHICLNFKAFHKNWIIFDKLAVEGPIPAHDIGETAAEKRIDKEKDKMITEIMKRSLIFFFITTICVAVAHYHISLAVQYRHKKLLRLLSGICKIGVCN